MREKHCMCVSFMSYTAIFIGKTYTELYTLPFVMYHTQTVFILKTAMSASSLVLRHLGNIYCIDVTMYMYNYTDIYNSDNVLQYIQIYITVIMYCNIYRYINSDNVLQNAIIWQG